MGVNFRSDHVHVHPYMYPHTHTILSPLPSSPSSSITSRHVLHLSRSSALVQVLSTWRIAAPDEQQMPRRLRLLTNCWLTPCLHNSTPIVDICEFDSLRGLGIVNIGRLDFDNRDRFAILIGSIGKATEPCQTSGCWHLTFDSFLNLDMGDDTNTKFLLLRVQTTYMT